MEKLQKGKNSHAFDILLYEALPIISKTQVIVIDEAGKCLGTPTPDHWCKATHLLLSHLDALWPRLYMCSNARGNITHTKECCFI